MPCTGIIIETIEDEVDRGYTASASGFGIHTQDDTLIYGRKAKNQAIDRFVIP